jgi:hypothetical protein
LAASNQFYGQNAQESINNNDKLFFNSYTIVVILGEYPFIPAFFGNGTEGAGGVANYESISSLLGMQTNADGTICYVPERFPENWYRRATPYGVAQLVAGLGPTYLSGPELVLPNPLGILQNAGQAPEIGCAIYQGLTGGIPAALLGETNDKLSQTVTFIQNQLLPQLPVSLLPPALLCHRLTTRTSTAAVRRRPVCRRTELEVDSMSPPVSVVRPTVRSAPKSLERRRKKERRQV